MIDKIIQDVHQQGWSYQQNLVDKFHLANLEDLFKTDFVPAGVGPERQRIEEIRGDWIKWLNPLHPPGGLEQEMEFLRVLQNELNQKLYLGLQDFECHLAKYPPGRLYKKHVDRFEKDSSRSISFIFYLHQKWSEADGGELVLYNKDGEVIKTILPLPGSILVFLSEDFPHEVKVCSQERKSLTGWIHTKILT
jgi:SM-20-related protein